MTINPPFPLAGELASLTAALIWSCTMSVFTRFGSAVPAAVLNLYKNFVAIVGLAVIALIIRPPAPQDSSLFLWLGASGIIGLSLGDTALFAALKRLGAQITSASQCLAPPIAAVIAVLTLGETLSRGETGGLLVTTCSIAAMLYMGRRGGAHLSTLPKRELILGIVFALIAATCQGAGLVIARYALQEVHILYGTMMRIAPAILVLWASMALSGERRPHGVVAKVFLTRRQGVLLTLASFAGTCLGLMLMSIGAKYAKAGVAAALTSTYPIWIIPIARFVLKERVSWSAVLCTLLAVCGIVMMIV